MDPGVHRVRRQAWRVRVASAQQAFAARSRLRSALEQDLPRVMSRAFDRAAPGAALLRIPRLELRLRVESLDALAGALAAALEHELAVHAPSAAAGDAPVEWLDTLVHYLESGALPWHAAHVEAGVLLPQLRATLASSLALLVQRRGAPFERALGYFFRLLQLLPEDRWIEAATHAVSGAQHDEAPADALDAQALPGVVRTDPEARTAAAFLRQPPPAAMAAALSARPAPPRHELLRLAAALLAAARAGLPAAPPAAFAWRERTRLESFQTRPETQRNAQSAGRANPAPQAFPLMAPHVGLVLLHPFLPQLFEACGFLDKDALEEPERAAALLHWLATGREEALEFELGFAKLLLGLRPQAPLPVGEGLVGAREREEGQALLEAVLAHWKALKGTTPDGLRVAFLQRRGALREADDGWRLQPESESYDVLLGHLPWGFATVKLPWMTRPLFTDWPTP